MVSPMKANIRRVQDEFPITAVKGDWGWGVSNLAASVALLSTATTYTAGLQEGQSNTVVYTEPWIEFQSL